LTLFALLFALFIYCVVVVAFVVCCVVVVCVVVVCVVVVCVVVALFVCVPAGRSAALRLRMINLSTTLSSDMPAVRPQMPGSRQTMEPSSVLTVVFTSTVVHDP
jgi:hypothetical protein